ncbi:hypothetical protein GRI40_08310 [Altererythrobacter aerius]|uniref:Uncharacterized protein n=1 Tax=Tsuneonella aeria TaxID=1837929 RepID=A0A6I4TF26_9SPHN|nr:hypothetical protein [Tsuneonella aeria]MXO75217.1 hypothetical protein [Tsuneonella aeria]
MIQINRTLAGDRPDQVGTFLAVMRSETGGDPGEVPMIDLVIHQRRRSLGGFEVGRVLPFVKRRMVGPFIFFDHMGPVDFAPGIPNDVDACRKMRGCRYSARWASTSGRAGGCLRPEPTQRSMKRAR